MDTNLLKEITLRLEDEHRRFTAAFCEESILDATSFEVTCDKSFVFRKWCEEHQVWHVLPARKQKPWRIVAECEQQISAFLAMRFAYLSPQREETILRQIREANAEYFRFLKELQDNCVDAQKEQKRVKSRVNRKMQKPPQVPAEQIPRKYLIEFATCYRKVKYHDHQEATSAILALHAREAHLMNSYHCKHCGTYHVGHMSNRRRQGKPVDPYRSAKRFWQQYPREADEFARKLGLL